METPEEKLNQDILDARLYRQINAEIAQHPAEYETAKKRLDDYCSAEAYWERRKPELQQLKDCLNQPKGQLQQLKDRLNQLQNNPLSPKIEKNINTIKKYVERKEAEIRTLEQNIKTKPQPGVLTSLVDAIKGWLEKREKSITEEDFRIMLLLTWRVKHEKGFGGDDDAEHTICALPVYKNWLKMLRKRRAIAEIQEHRVATVASGEETGKAIEYSLPLPMSKWAGIFGMDERTLQKLASEGKYHFNKISARKFRLPLNELPTEYLTKYRPATR